MELDGNQGTRMNVALSLLTSISAIFLALRVSRKLLGRQKLWWDDYILTASWITFLVAVITNGVGISLGFGKHIYVIDVLNIRDILLLRLLTGTFMLLASALSKTSFAVTLLGRVDSQWRVFVWIVIASTHVVIGLAAVLQWVQCTPVEILWDMSVSGTCWNQSAVYGYIIFIRSFSVVMDIVLTILPWRVMSAPQLSRTEKLGAASATCVGLCVAGAAVATTVIQSALRSSSDPLYDHSSLVIWGGVEVAMTIVAVSILAPGILVRKANSSTRRGSTSNDGIEVSHSQHYYEQRGMRISNKTLNGVSAELNEVNELDAAHTSRTQERLAEVDQPELLRRNQVEPSHRVQVSASELENSNSRPSHAIEMDQGQQPRPLVSELAGYPVNPPAELPNECATAVAAHRPELATQQSPRAISRLPTTATEPDVAELLRSQAQLQERRRRLLQLQQIDEQEEAIRQQLLQLQSKQMK